MMAESSANSTLEANKVDPANDSSLHTSKQKTSIAHPNRSKTRSLQSKNLKINSFELSSGNDDYDYSDDDDSSKLDTSLDHPNNLQETRPSNISSVSTPNLKAALFTPYKLGVDNHSSMETIPQHTPSTLDGSKDDVNQDSTHNIQLQNEYSTVSSVYMDDVNTKDVITDTHVDSLQSSSSSPVKKNNVLSDTVSSSAATRSKKIQSDTHDSYGESSPVLPISPSTQSSSDSIHHFSSISNSSDMIQQQQHQGGRIHAKLSQDAHTTHYQKSIPPSSSSSHFSHHATRAGYGNNAVETEVSDYNSDGEELYSSNRHSDDLARPHVYRSTQSRPLMRPPMIVPENALNMRSNTLLGPSHMKENSNPYNHSSMFDEEDVEYLESSPSSSNPSKPMSPHSSSSRSHPRQSNFQEEQDAYRNKNDQKNQPWIESPTRAFSSSSQTFSSRTQQPMHPSSQSFSSRTQQPMHPSSTHNSVPYESSLSDAYQQQSHQKQQLHTHSSIQESPPLHTMDHAHRSSQDNMDHAHRSSQDNIVNMRHQPQHVTSQDQLSNHSSIPSTHSPSTARNFGISLINACVNGAGRFKSFFIRRNMASVSSQQDPKIKNESGSSFPTRDSSSFINHPDHQDSSQSRYNQAPSNHSSHNNQLHQPYYENQSQEAMYGSKYDYNDHQNQNYNEQQNYNHDHHNHHYQNENHHHASPPPPPPSNSSRDQKPSSSRRYCCCFSFKIIIVLFLVLFLFLVISIGGYYLVASLPSFNFRSFHPFSTPAPLPFKTSPSMGPLLNAHTDAQIPHHIPSTKINPPTTTYNPVHQKSLDGIFLTLDRLANQDVWLWAMVVQNLTRQYMDFTYRRIHTAPASIVGLPMFGSKLYAMPITDEIKNNQDYCQHVLYETSFKESLLQTTQQTIVSDICSRTEDADDFVETTMTWFSNKNPATVDFLDTMFESDVQTETVYENPPHSHDDIDPNSYIMHTEEGIIDDTIAD